VRHTDILRTRALNVSPLAAKDSAQPRRFGPLPWLCFGATTALAILELGEDVPAAVDRLLLGAGAGALVTALGWIAILALRRGGGWTWAVALGIWIPYVNLIIAARYAQRHWRDDAAAPGWLALGGFTAQLVVSLRMLFAAPPPLA
jgi:hypothetical protein